MKDKFTFKVSYPDGDVEFWYNTVSQTIAEMSRLQKLHDNKIEIEFIEQEKIYNDRENRICY